MKCFTLRNVDNKNALPDHGVVLVVGVVRVSQLSVRPELKLQELVTELALVPHVVAQIKIVAHFSGGVKNLVLNFSRKKMF